MTKVSDLISLVRDYDALLKDAQEAADNVIATLRARIPRIAPYIRKYPELDLRTINGLAHCDACQHLIALTNRNWDKFHGIYIESMSEFVSIFNVLPRHDDGSALRQLQIEVSMYDFICVPSDFIDLPDEELDNYLENLFAEGAREARALRDTHRTNHEASERKKLAELLDKFGYPNIEELEDKYGSPDIN